MGITSFEPPPLYPDENRRERAVEASGVLEALNDTALHLLVEAARSSFGVPMAAISIVYRDWQYLIAASGLPTGPYSRHTSFCGHVITEPDRVLCVPDALADPRFAGNPAVTAVDHVRFYAGAKLLDPEGLPLGALCVFGPQPRPCLHERDEACLAAMAREAMARIGELGEHRRASGWVGPAGNISARSAAVPAGPTA